MHFVLIGAGLFALLTHRPGPSPRPPREPVVVSAADVARLREGWVQEYGVTPTRAQEAVLVDASVDDEVLHREALALGLDRRDPVVRERLVGLARFVADGPLEDEEAIERDARALGLDRADLVLRRHLVQGMRQLLAGAQRSELPDETTLAAYLAAHADEFAEPPTVGLTHVYLSADRRGAAVATDARALLGRLRREQTPAAAGPERGDAFVGGAQLSHASATDLERVFGPGFAAAVAALPLQTWAGPVPSTYGLHLVWVHERTPARVPALAEVRAQVIHRVLRERRAARLRSAVAALRGRYDVRIEGR